MIAVQYILYILFPDFDVAQNIFYYFRFKRFHDQWNLNLCTTTIFFCECDMVCDANLWNCLYLFLLWLKCINSQKNYHVKI